MWAVLLRLVNIFVCEQPVAVCCCVRSSFTNSSPPSPQLLKVSLFITHNIEHNRSGDQERWMGGGNEFFYPLDDHRLLELIT